MNTALLLSVAAIFVAGGAFGIALVLLVDVRARERRDHRDDASRKSLEGAIEGILNDRRRGVPNG